MSIEHQPQMTDRFSDFWEKSYDYRYYILFTSLMVVLVLPAFTPNDDEGLVWAIARSFVLLSCVNVLRNMSHLTIWVIVLGLAATASEWLAVFNLDTKYTMIAGFLLYVCFVVLISYQVFKEILTAMNIDMHMIVGAFCGFMLIGIIASLIFMFIHIGDPGSFSNVREAADASDDLFYFSFITILTIGYGDIAPVTDEARSISLFFGLIGQFYLVVIMAVLVGKFIGGKSE